jgi:Ca-activated chloride channel homolog
VKFRSTTLSAIRAFALFSLCVFLAIFARPIFSQASQPPAPPQAPAQSAQAPASPSSSDSQNAPAPLAPQEPPLKVTTGLVHLVVTVTDKHHEFVTDLDKTDFKVLENGTPQDIRFFGQETELPLRIALLLDTSNSIRPRLEFEKDAAVDFLDKVIRRGQDSAFLMTFDNDPQIIQDYTDDRALLASSVRDQRAGGGTALNDAIFLASQKLLHAPLPRTGPSDIRRVIVVISDGDDNLSDHALSDAIDASIRAEAVVFTVSTNTDWLAIDNPSKPSKYNLDPGDKVLQQYADQTGGHSYFPYNTDDLAESFEAIGTELRSQYFIAYAPVPPPDVGQYRTVDVRTDRKGLIVRTRKGYYATAAQPAAGSAR